MEQAKSDSKPKITSSPSSKGKGNAAPLRLSDSDNDDHDEWEYEDPPMEPYDDEEDQWMEDDIKNWMDDVVIVDGMGKTAATSGSKSPNATSKKSDGQSPCLFIFRILDS